MNCKYCNAEMKDLSTTDIFKALSKVGVNKIKQFICMNKKCPERYLYTYEYKGETYPASDSPHFFKGIWYTGKEWAEYINEGEIK